MTEPKVSFFARLLLALQAFWRTLSDPEFARDVARSCLTLPSGFDPAAIRLTGKVVG